VYHFCHRVLRCLFVEFKVASSQINSDGTSLPVAPTECAEGLSVGGAAENGSCEGSDPA